jgi:hypothetical protein
MRNGLINYAEYSKLVEETAYYMWLDGSDDTEHNWYSAVLHVPRPSQLTNKFPIYLERWR